MSHLLAISFGPHSRSLRNQAQKAGLIDFDEGTTKWRALHGGFELEADPFADEDQSELMSFYDWAIQIGSYFDPLHERTNEPAGRSFFRERYRQRRASTSQTSGPSPAADHQHSQAVSGLSQAMQTMSSAAIFEKKKPRAPPPLGKCSNQAYQKIRRDVDKLAKYCASTSQAVVFALAHGIDLASVPDVYFTHDQPMLVEREGVLVFPVQPPTEAPHLSLQDPLRLLLLVQTPTREQIIPSGTLFTALRSTFPETITQHILNLLHPGIHSVSSLRKCLRDSSILELANALARGEFADHNLLFLSVRVSEVTGCHLFLHGPKSLNLASGRSTEMIALDAQSQAMTNRCIDAFIFHAIGLQKAFSTWWHNEGKCALMCIIKFADKGLYDAELSPATLSQLSSQLRLLLAKISEAVRQGAKNFTSIDFSTAMGEAMHHLLAVSKQCFLNLSGAIGLSGSTLYDKVDPSQADEYFKLCSQTSSPRKAVSISTPSKQRKPHTPERPSKRRAQKHRHTLAEASEDGDSDSYLSSGQESAASTGDEL